MPVMALWILSRDLFPPNQIPVAHGKDLARVGFLASQVFGPALVQQIIEGRRKACPSERNLVL